MNTLLKVGLDNALVVLILAPVVAGLCRACRRPALEHALWLLVLLKLITPPLPWKLSVPIATAGASSLAGPRAISAIRDLIASSVGNSGMWMLEGLWFAGSAAWFAVTAWQVVRFRRFLAATLPASPDLQNRIRVLAERLRLRRAPGVWLVRSTIAPMVWAAGCRPR